MVDFVFLDSGTGGIPYLSNLIKMCPASSCIYVGDTKNFPYGEKNHEQIVNCVLSIVANIIEHFDPKVIVIACNTMSVNALDVLREAFPNCQFVGTVPAIKLASSISKNRTIGLLATNATCAHPYNMDLKNHFAADCKLVLHSAPELIDFIEHQSFTATKEECIKAISPSIDFFIKKNVDVIILGCTHFLNLSELFQEVCDKLSDTKIKVVDSVEGVTKRAISLLQNSTYNKSPTKPKLYVTGFTEQKDKAEYDVICNRFGLDFGGII